MAPGDVLCFVSLVGIAAACKKLLVVETEDDGTLAPSSSLHIGGDCDLEPVDDILDDEWIIYDRFGNPCLFFDAKMSAPTDIRFRKP